MFKRKLIAGLGCLLAAGFITSGATASASPTPELRTASVILPANSVYHAQINDTVEADLMKTPAKSVWATSLNKGIVAESNLTPAVKKKLNAGMFGYEEIGRPTDANATTGFQEVVSKCAEGEKVLSGGIQAAIPAEVTTHDSYPSGITRVGPDTKEDPSGLWVATSWTTHYTNTGTGSVQPHLICVVIGQVGR
jgi:hypothetical protein